MFGWEFPPHIAGGLGTACYGMTRGLARNGVEVVFVMPRAYGDEDQRFVRVVNASDVETIGTRDHEFSEELLEKVSFIHIDSNMLPYISPEEYAAYHDEFVRSGRTHEWTDVWKQRYTFSGKYGANLMEEVARYAMVAAQVAKDLEGQFDVIHAHDWLTYFAGIAAKRVSGKPLVVHMHATEFDRSGENINRRVYAIEKAGMQAADRVIAVSELTRRIVIGKYGILADKVVTVHNAVRFGESEEAAPERAVKDKVVTFLGRITYQKGPDYFVEAAAKVLQRVSDVRFVMAGSGDLMNHVVRRVAQLGIADRFHFTGFLKGTFDILYRYLTHLGYKVRYVRNITDVGHLEHDADDGEDKIAKKARLEQLEPMEVVQYYLNRYHKAMEALNVLPPSIEPHASGHIIEQIQLVEEILKNGYAYESKGSVYFDVAKYNKDHHYGVLSGRNLDDVLNTTRELDGQEEKHNPADFALWKCAQPEHIMRWPSPWSNGFPGWHCECTAMGRKYLGETFDIHGGGMDLVFPHHECEIAQAVASEGHQMVHYWMHNNMITINGQKMGKSLGNFITLDEFFTGSNKLLTQAYSPMTIRFFILQAHYRSTVDFSNEALQAAEKGLERLLEGVKNLERITPAKATSGIEPQGLREKCYEAMNDDLNTPIVISHLFDATRMINTVIDKKATISAEDLEELKSVFHLFVFDLLGLKAEAENNAAREEAYGKVVDMLLEQRMQAKANKDWATSDKIRDNLAALGFEVKDTKDGFTWKLNK